jgi:hypothetical protein
VPPREQDDYSRATPGYPRSSASLSADTGRRRPEVDDDGPRSSTDAGRPSRPGRRSPEVAEQGSRLRGSLAVLGVLVVTFAAGYVDAIGTTGLGMITLIGLVASTAVATLLVRRRDLMTLVVAPPLVLMAVVAVFVVMAPGFDVPADKNAIVVTGTAVATKLVLGGGFPIMAAATGTALVLALIRWAARR